MVRFNHTHTSSFPQNNASYCQLRSEFGEDGADGLPVYLSPPPAYPPIRGNLSTSANNLFACYVDMSPSELKCEPSELDLDQLRLARFGHVVTLGLLEAVFESEK